MRCIECSNEEDSDVAGFYLEAAHCVKNISTNKYLEYAKIAIDKFCLAARISQAANLAKEIAEKMEEDMDYEEAYEFYNKAADLYFNDESTTQGNQLLIKSSDLLILSRDWSKINLAIKVLYLLLLNFYIEL
jgi:hypothetical protein